MFGYTDLALRRDTYFRRGESCAKFATANTIWIFIARALLRKRPDRQLFSTHSLGKLNRPLVTMGSPVRLTDPESVV